MTMPPVPTGRHEKRGTDDAIVLTRELRAPIEDVWSSVTESERLARWIGTWTGDPAEGFVTFTMNAEEEEVPPSRYDIRECDPPRLLRVDAVDDFGTWRLVVELAEQDGTTTLRLSQVIDDPSMIENTGPGWEYYLDRLHAATRGEDPGAVDFDDYYPAQQEHYLAITREITGA